VKFGRAGKGLIDFDLWRFNATFNNSSAISSVVVVASAPFFCNLQSRARTHAVLVIGLYELLDPTT
jgi:hypothetical protein